MTKKEMMFALRNDPEIHYNCAQSILIPFAEEIGMSKEQANALALNFGGGMGCGAICGALTGALMVMGGLGMPQEKRTELIGLFKEKWNSMDCGVLTCGLERGSPEMRAVCDPLIEFCNDYICRKTGLE